MMQLSGFTINLSGCPEGIAFPTKYIPLSKSTPRVVLGRSTGAPCYPTNGLFSYNKDSEDPPLSSSHAELWLESGKVYINDMNSHAGTYVNDIRISTPTVLNTGDIVTLGVAKKERPVVMRVTIS